MTAIVTSGAAMSTCAGQIESGDRYVLITEGERALLGVIDGLGHGTEAAEASRLAVAAIERRRTANLADLMMECHDSLRRTRGAVMSLASIDARTNALTWVGIGNVEGLLLTPTAMGWRGRESLLLSSGVVGYRITKPRPKTVPLDRGDALVFATDGIRTGFSAALNTHASAQSLADNVLTTHGKNDDDALVVVMIYDGWPA